MSGIGFLSLSFSLSLSLSLSFSHIHTLSRFLLPEDDWGESSLVAAGAYRGIGAGGDLGPTSQGGWNGHPVANITRRERQRSACALACAILVCTKFKH